MLNQGLENVHGFDKVRKETELKKKHKEPYAVYIVFTDIKSITWRLFLWKQNVMKLWSCLDIRRDLKN